MNNENKSKNKLIIIICVLALVCVFAVLVFSGIFDLSKITGDESTTEEYEGLISDSYVADISATATQSLPYLKTDIENIFYTIDADGNVKFYKLENNTFTQVDATGTYSTSVVLSEMKISADITYYKTDEKICGYGVYTADENVYTLYPYAFFCLRSYGENYEGSSSSSCLLLIDTTQEDFYSNDKIFEESFTFKFSDSSASRSISEASRTVGISGAKRDDYFFINDTTVENSVANQLFFSGRYYAESDTKVDIMRTGGSGNNTDNIRIAKNVLGYWLYNDGTDLTYVTEDESGNVAVQKYNWKSQTAETVKIFEGVSKDKILLSGNYMYVNGKNIIYNLVDNTESSLAYGKANALVADTFVADGENILIRGYVNNEYPVVIIANGETGKVSSSYANNIFRDAVNPVVLENGQFMFTTENTEGYSYYLF
ncbi:MAG: hypothetical protein IJZ35_09915 [Clostridia bacterium]|nr:hypothetical protein [Clostridia bacterium]